MILFQPAFLYGIPWLSNMLGIYWICELLHIPHQSERKLSSVYPTRHDMVLYFQGITKILSQKLKFMYSNNFIFMVNVNTLLIPLLVPLFILVLIPLFMTAFHTWKTGCHGLLLKNNSCFQLLLPRLFAIFVNCQSFPTGM